MDSKTRRTAEKNRETLTRWGIRAQDHEDFTALFLVLRGARKRRDLLLDVADAACDSGLTGQRVRGLVRRYAACLRVAEYMQGSYERSGSGAFGHYGNARGGYVPAALLLER